MHGGKSLVGVASRTHRGRGYSIDLPTRLADRFRLAEADPELLSFRGDTALLTVRAEELIRRLHTGESGSLWRELLDNWNDVISASDQDKMSAAMATHGEIISKGVDDENTWKELAAAIHQRVAVASQEHSRLVDLQLMLPVEQAMTFVSILKTAIEAEVPDPAVRRRIADRFRRFMNRPEKTSSTSGGSGCAIDGEIVTNHQESI
jgi:hypothetical protein